MGLFYAAFIERNGLQTYDGASWEREVYVAHIRCTIVTVVCVGAKTKNTRPRSSALGLRPPRLSRDGEGSRWTCRGESNCKIGTNTNFIAGLFVIRSNPHGADGWPRGWARPWT